MIPPSPEYRLLLCCAGVGPGASRYVRLQEALSQVADWRQLRRIALLHGVLPSLCRCLDQTAPEVLPPASLKEIQDLYKVHAQRNLRITGELIRLLNLLAGHRVMAIPFKGPVLAQVAYGDITLRQFADLDLLVRQEDIPKVKNLLLCLGYQLDHSYTPKQEEDHLRHINEFSFFHPQKTILDVHWRFTPQCLGGGPDINKALARRVPVNLLGKTLYTLCPVDHLLVLCLLGFHPCVHLSQISDVARLIKSQPHWDWEALLHEAEAGGIRRMVLLSLSLAHEVLGAPVPAHITALAGEDQVVARLCRQIWQSLFCYPESEPDLASMALFHWQTRERFFDKLNYLRIRTLVPTVQDWRWVSLPDSKYWLYYFLRPFRLFTQGVLRPLRHWYSRGL